MIQCPKCEKETFEPGRRFCYNKNCGYRDISPIKEQCPKCRQRTFSSGSKMCYNSRCRHHETNVYLVQEDKLVPEPNWDVLQIEQEFVSEAQNPWNRIKPPPNRKLMSGAPTKFKPGFIYSCTYSNYHNDPNPMLFVLAANEFDVWGLNIYYLKKNQIHKLQSLIQAIRNSVQGEKNFHNPKEFYHRFLKHQYKDLIDISFRRYKNRWLMGSAQNGGIYQYLDRKTPPLVSSKYMKTKLNKLAINHPQYNTMLTYRDKLEQLKVKVKGLAFRHKI